MKSQLKLCRQTRANFIKLIQTYSIDQLNQIPDGFSNNLIWNFGHIIITQHLLTYGLCGMDMEIDEGLLSRLRKGSKPEDDFSEEELELLLELAESSLIRLSDDLDADLLEIREPYPTSYGFTIHTIEDALEFDAAHEALHLGYAMALRKHID